jgi:Family of unknown function (DUF6364)
MYTKLTLNITDTVVENAKRTARKRKTSVSRLVEDFLSKISEERETSIVKSIIENAPKIINAYLKKKHGV